MTDRNIETDGPYLPSFDIVVGDRILYTESVFGGSFRRPKYIGERTILADVLRESYGETTGQHTFSLQVIEAFGEQPPKAGAKIRRKGRNIYRNGVSRREWSDESKRAAIADEKHIRGDAARVLRAIRKARILENIRNPDPRRDKACAHQCRKPRMASTTK